MRARIPGCVFCIENGYTGGKNGWKFWRDKMGGGCWEYREPIERDDKPEWLVWAWYREWIDRRQIGSRKCVTNQVKLRIFHE